MDQEGNGHDFGAVRSGKMPRGLLRHIVDRIQAEKKLASSRKRATYFSIALGASVAAFMTAFFALQGALLQTEMMRALSLVFSDPTAVVADWKDFSLFFLESLPVGYIVLFLAALFALLESLKYVVKYIAAVFSFSKLVEKS